MGLLRDVGVSLLIGGGAVVAGASVISTLVSKDQVNKIKDSPWRCAYDGLRFPDENSLIDHLINTHRPEAPADPRKFPPPAPLVLLHPIPNPRFPELTNAYGLWRIRIDHERELPKSPMFVLEQLKWWLSPEMGWELEWVIGWCGKGKIEIATTPEGPWLKRGVTCRVEGEYPVGGFTLVASSTLDGYIRIPELRLEPILIYKGRK